MTVFLSYPRANVGTLDALTAELDGMRIGYWVDRRDIPVSVPWFDEVREAIRAASMFIVCESFEWYESEACRIELLTAQELHKRVVHIDLGSQAPADAAGLVRRAASDLTPLDRAHTELLVRSASWDRAGRESSALVGGPLLGQLQQVGAPGGRPLPSEARDFLAAGSRLDRRRRRLRGAGAAGVVVLLIIAWLGWRVQERGDEQARQSAQTFSAAAEAHYRTAADPYDGLRLAAERFRENVGAFARQPFFEALNVPVPVASRELRDAAVIGFAGTPGNGAPTVVDAAGHSVDGADADPRSSGYGPVERLSSSSDGAVAAWLHGGSVSVRANGSDVESPCSGSRFSVSASGRSLASSSGSDLCVWQIGGDVEYLTVPGDVRITQLAAGDGLVVAGTESGDVLFYGAAGPPTVVAGDGASVTALDLDESGERVVVAKAGHGIVEVFGPTAPSLLRSLKTGGPVGAVALSRDGRMLAAGVGENIVLVDILSGQRKVALRGSRGVVRDVAWSNDDRSVWAVAGEHRVSRWQWHTGRRIVDDPSQWFVVVSPPSPAGEVIAVTQEGGLWRIDLASGAAVVAGDVGVDRVLTAAFSPSLDTALVGTSDRELVMHDLGSGRSRAIPAGDCQPAAAAFVEDSRAAVVACYGGPVRRVDVDREVVTAELAVPYGGAGTLAAGPGNVLYIGGSNGDVYRAGTDLAALEPISDQNLNPTVWRAAAVSPDGNTIMLVGHGTGKIGYLAVGLADGPGWAWYQLTLAATEAEQARAVAISADGSTAAVGLADGSVHYVELGGGDRGWTRTEPAGAVTGMTFVGPDLVTVTRDGVVDVVEGCTYCQSPSELLELAQRRLGDARTMGLIGE